MTTIFDPIDKIMKSRPVKELSSHDRRILLNTCYGHFMSHFNMLVFPALVLPLAARLGIETVFFFLTLMVVAALGFILWLITKSRQCDDVKGIRDVGIRVPTAKL